MPKDKGPKKPKYKVRERRAGPKMSRGRRQFQVGKELRAQAESYTEQATTEAGKAGKRKSASSWGSLIGAIGVPLAVLALSNPTTAFGYLAMAGMAGGGALAGSAAGVAQAKSGGTLGGKARRKDVEVEKFYTSEAEQASKDIKEIDKQTQRQAYISAGTSAILAGIGAAAKAGKFATTTTSMQGTGEFVGGTAIEGAVAGETGSQIMKEVTTRGSMFSKFGDLGKKLGQTAFSGKEMDAWNIPFSAGVKKAGGPVLASLVGKQVFTEGYGLTGEKPRTQYESPYTQNRYRRTSRA